ncbi:MAG: long-chain fatty acid--CoA ligase [Microthrixaceae bacterium]|nr:long-chain fatty acid--CoA ligase [Microthrixaceae bacterium]
MNLATIFDRHPDTAVAFISRGKNTTYGELREQVAGYRAGLIDLGLEPGDRVAIICGNNWYFVAAYLATLGAGLVAVPLNPMSPPLELSGQLATVGARGVVIGPTARTMFETMDRSTVPTVDVFIGCGFVPEGGVSHEELVARDGAPIVERDDDDLAVLMFTSGTAGSPKAAMLTHGNLRANIAQVLSTPGNEQNPDDVVFAVLPMFHIFGLNVVLGVTFAVGARLLLVERFDPISAIESIQKHQATVITGPPTMWAAWAGLPEAPDGAFASVRIAVSGAARLPDEVARTMDRRYGIQLIEGYGLTEASPVVTSAVATSAPIGSVGVPLPGLEVRLVDEDGDDVLIGDSGELWVRGPNVFAGYWGDPEATARTINSDGWLITGDVATVDDDGFLFLVDRVKDLIIVSGFNVYPAEVEEVLMSHPAIDACAVVGVPHPYSGEAVKAYVVAVKGESIEEDEVVRFCAGRLARYKCPEKVWFVDEVPQGMGGKVLRRALR